MSQVIRQHLLSVFGTKQQKVAAFCKDRVPQSDEQFICECGLPDDPEAARIGMAIRRAVANVGVVDHRFIRADDSYPDTLGVLPLWDSMDWLQFALEVEKELGDWIDLDEWDRVIRSPDYGDQRTWWQRTTRPDPIFVKQLAWAAYHLVQRKAETK